MDLDESRILIREIVGGVKRSKHRNGTTIVCPPFTSLALARDLLIGSGIQLGAQNLSHLDGGAYTGEISGRMLASAGCTHVIIGHSERRQHYGETDLLVNAKTLKALQYGMVPIVCVGETLTQREEGITMDVIANQVRSGLVGLSAEQARGIIVAYEPVWAIGTGRTATPEQAQTVHKGIRALLEGMFGKPAAEGIVIQYGGSVKPDNAVELLAQSDIDGALVGGACLNAESFLSIINSCPA